MSGINNFTNQTGSEEFGIYVQDGYNLVKVRGELSSESLEVAVANVVAVDAESPQHYLLDFSTMDRVGNFWGRFMVQLKKKIGGKRAKRQVRIINANPELIASLKSLGLDRAVPVSANLEVAFRDLGLERKLIFDPHVVVAFINSTIRTLHTMAQTSSQKEPAVLKDVASGAQGEVCGMIAIDCPSFHGVFIISFPKDTILKLASKIAGAPLTEVNSLVQSAVGEIVNVSVTGAKKTLNDAGYGVQVDLPRITIDGSLPPELLKDKENCVVVPFSTEAGSYFIDIRFRSNEPDAKGAETKRSA